MFKKVHFGIVYFDKILYEINIEDSRFMKIITICGSLKFEEEIKYNTEKLELDGNCVLCIAYPTKKKESYTQEEIKILDI